MKIWTIGYGQWLVAHRVERMMEALRRESVTRVVDVRLSPAASDPEPG